MKKKIKNIILYFSVFYMIIIVVLMIESYIGMNTDIINLSVSDKNIEEINEYKNKISSLDNFACKKYLNSLVNRFEKDINREKMNLKDYYKEITGEDSILNYYTKDRENCEILTNDVMIKANMPIMFITASIQNDELVEDYFFQYELGFKDYKTRDLRKLSLVGVRYNIKINNELRIIEELLKIVSGEKEV